MNQRGDSLSLGADCRVAHFARPTRAWRLDTHLANSAIRRGCLGRITRATERIPLRPGINDSDSSLITFKKIAQKKHLPLASSGQVWSNRIACRTLRAQPNTSTNRAQNSMRKAIFGVATPSCTARLFSYLLSASVLSASPRFLGETLGRGGNLPWHARSSSSCCLSHVAIFPSHPTSEEEPI